MLNKNKDVYILNLLQCSLFLICDLCCTTGTVFYLKQKHILTCCPVTCLSCVDLQEQKPPLVIPGRPVLTPAFCQSK